jgi:hypothetical protein
MESKYIELQQQLQQQQELVQQAGEVVSLLKDDLEQTKLKLATVENENEILKLKLQQQTSPQRPINGTINKNQLLEAFQDLSFQICGSRDPKMLSAHLNQTNSRFIERMEAAEHNLRLATDRLNALECERETHCRRPRSNSNTMNNSNHLILHGGDDDESPHEKTTTITSRRSLFNSPPLLSSSNKTDGANSLLNTITSSTSSQIQNQQQPTTTIKLPSSSIPPTTNLESKKSLVLSSSSSSSSPTSPQKNGTSLPTTTTTTTETSWLGTNHYHTSTIGNNGTQRNTILISPTKSIKSTNSGTNVLSKFDEISNEIKTISNKLERNGNHHKHNEIFLSNGNSKIMNGNGNSKIMNGNGNNGLTSSKR